MKMLQIRTILANSSVQKMGLLRTYLVHTPADKVSIIRIMRVMPRIKPIELKREAIFLIINNRPLVVFIEIPPLPHQLTTHFLNLFAKMPGKI
jgi:hypothetical protein